MEALKLRRASAKSAITRIDTWYEKNKQSESDYFQFQQRLEGLKDSFELYNEIQQQIEELEPTQESDRNTVEDKYYTLSANLRKCISKLSPENRAEARTEVIHSSTSAQINKPQLNIPPFSGSLIEWESFYQLFEALIENDNSLSEVQKLVYLRTYLLGEPHHLISNLKLIGSNFHVALATLKERYANQLNIIYAHIKNLLNVPSIGKCNANSLRDFITCIKQNCEGLRNLQVDVDAWELILVYIFSEKLDPGTRKSYDFELKVGDRPTLKGFLQFLDNKCMVLERSVVPDLNNSTKRVYKHPQFTHVIQNNSQGRTQPSSTHGKQFQQQVNCLYCKLSGHKIYKCGKFTNLPHSDKLKFVKFQKLCFNCLASQHQSSDCQSQGCFICKQRHHTLLHHERQRTMFHGQGEPHSSYSLSPPNTVTNNNIHRSNSYTRSNNGARGNTNHLISDIPYSNNSSTENPPDATTTSQHTLLSNTSNSAVASTEVLLATAQVKVCSVENKPLYVRAVLDSCSTVSLISTRLIQALGLTTTHGNIQIAGIHGITTQTKKTINLSIYSTAKPNWNVNTSFWVLDKITENIPQFNIRKDMISIPDACHLADPNFHIPGQIDILLGADVYYSIVYGTPSRIPGNLLYLIETHFGHIISGPVPSQNIIYNSKHFSHCTSHPEADVLSNRNCFLIQGTQVDQLIENFWFIEHIPDSNQKRLLTPDEQLSEDLFVKSITTLKDNSLQVDLPLKSSKEHLKLGGSFMQATKRFYCLEKRFKQNPHLFRDYKAFIDEYVSLGHGKYVPLSLVNELGENKYFIPHHCIIRDDHTTTKLRVVFDASMKSTSGASLNDIMFKGYQVQPELFDIICRFRTFKFVLIADIEKMFRQVKVNPKQVFLQNILWRENPQSDLKCIELQTLSYGTNSAPFLATRSLHYLADKFSDKFPLAADVIRTQCYVDDILCGTNSLETLNELYSQLVNLFKLANLNLHKWNSNSQEILNHISPSSNQCTYELKAEKSVNKVLGVSWNPVSDEFSISSPISTQRYDVTKRAVLSLIAQIFDPLGCIGPVIVVAKVIMQNIWISKIDWDEDIPLEIASQWTKFMQGISSLSCLKIPRHLFSNFEPISIDIHGFSDASLRAYGACIYVRTTYKENKVSCNLLTSKSRIAPIKTISLPRLELCAAVLLAKLTEHILSVLENSFTVSTVNLWTDSQIALCWLRSHPSRWTIFVSNRVAEIQQTSKNAKWRHIKSSDNPADILSRGATPQELIQSTLWWHGPSFLSLPNLDLATFDEKITLQEFPEEKKNKPVLVINTIPYWWNYLTSKFSNFSRLVRTLAFCKRFIHNLKPTNNLCKRLGPLTVGELQQSELIIINELQKQHFAQEISQIKSQKVIANKHILQLSPFLDESGTLRVGGRLANSKLSYFQKHPCLLPSKNKIVSLMLEKEHVLLGHAGAQNVLSNFRQKYWPLGGLKEIKRIIRKCHTCYRFKAIVSQQIMAHLPKDRVQPSRPFSKVGVDFGGPLFIKSSKLRRSSLTKCYIALFVCLATKAVHIELVSDLSTDAFILTLKRFISRRGNPAVIYSDNATNFAGAKNKIKELYNLFLNTRFTEVTNFLNTKEIQWLFIPPRSPHWGGLWEAAIKGTKYHLTRIVGQAHLTFEELSTILAQIEAILNSRPLHPLSNDPTDLHCLTPGHFLIGERLTAFPEFDLTDISENRLSRWQKCTKLQQHFWNRWSKEYLNTLQNKPKWLRTIHPVKVNDIVLLKDGSSNKPLEWPLARVLETFPGTDGKVRVVKVKTKDGVFMRNITKLCPLPMETH